MEYTLTSSSPSGDWEDNGGQLRTVFIDTTNSVWDGATLQIEVSPNRQAIFGEESELEFTTSQTAPRNFVYAAGSYRPTVSGAGGATSVKVIIK